jgi:hypothetical protein
MRRSSVLLADTTLFTHPLIATADAHFEWANRGCPEGEEGISLYFGNVWRLCHYKDWVGHCESPEEAPAARPPRTPAGRLARPASIRTPVWKERSREIVCVKGARACHGSGAAHQIWGIEALFVRVLEYAREMGGCSGWARWDRTAPRRCHCAAPTIVPHRSGDVAFPSARNRPGNLGLTWTPHMDAASAPP